MTRIKKDSHNLTTLPLTASQPSLLPDGSDQVLRHLTLGFAVLGWQLIDIRASFGKLLHLSPFQYVALQAIARIDNNEPWTTRFLAKHFRVTNAYVSMEIRPLVQQGLISSLANPDDKRVKLLSVTPKGNSLLTKLAPIQQQVNDRLFSQFNEARLLEQCRTIERMIEDAERAKKHLQDVLSNRGF
ncbi:MAG: MarR family winged helix-turn-helix transcriptional regulator [Advenella sp.]|nr:MarR family winged helix-turn-helix transcriptional regulator [Advenella sp. FME57]